MGMAYSPLVADSACSCGFSLWNPIAESVYSSLGLYDDARFPGRSILRLNQHHESLEDVPDDVLNAFMQDIKTAMTAIRTVTGAARVNVSILGNRDPHVHAHLIPRFPDEEEFPDCSPWNDLRPKTALETPDKSRIITGIREAITRFPTEQ